MIFSSETDGCRTTAAVAAEDGTHLASLGIVGEGLARCREDDAFSTETGLLIALGRAIEDYGRQVVVAGDAKVVTKKEVERVLDLIDEIADEEGATTMAVGKGADSGGCAECGQDLESPSCDPEPTEEELREEEIGSIIDGLLVGLLLQQEGV